MKFFTRLLCALSTILLTSVLSFAQETQQPLRDKFLQPAISKPEDKLFKPFGRGFKWSTLVYAAGTSADILTSQGKGFYEGNPLFRSRDGSVDNGRAVAAAVGIYGGTLLMERRWPKGAFVLRVVIGVVRGFFGLRNLR